MRTEKVGARVGAVLSTDPKTKSVKLLGYGVYLGNLVPPDHREQAVLTVERYRKVLQDPTIVDPNPELTKKMLAEPDEKIAERLREMNGRDYCPWRNPCILLDNQEYVWGMECWWGAEGAVRASLEGFTVEEYSIRKARIEAGLDGDRAPLDPEEDPFYPVLKQKEESGPEESASG